MGEASEIQHKAISERASQSDQDTVGDGGPNYAHPGGDEIKKNKTTGEDDRQTRTQKAKAPRRKKCRKCSKEI